MNDKIVDFLCQKVDDEVRKISEQLHKREKERDEKIAKLHTLIHSMLRHFGELDVTKLEKILAETF